MAPSGKKIVCYYCSWAKYRTGDGKFTVSKINPDLCTHLIYAFLGIDESGEIREENVNENEIRRFNKLKKRNPHLKTLVAVGGWNEGSSKFSKIAKSPTRRRRFIKNAIEFLEKYDFDGLDIDWEYPAQRDGDPEVDKENFTILLRELERKFSRRNLLLTAAVAAGPSSARQSYDIGEISQYLDFINLMAYDMRDASYGTVGMNAPLRGSGNTVRKTINYWLREGAPADKIMLGVPFYGRTFTLEYARKNDVGSPCTRSGEPGEYTDEAGMLGYNEICEKFENEDWTKRWDETREVPYAYKGNQWISYDNPTSIENKVNYAYEKNLGGIMVWSIDTDDFRGACGETYPLIKKINSVIKNHEQTFCNFL